MAHKLTDIDTVKTMYLEDNLTPAEIGVHFNCAKTSVLAFLRKHNVSIKTRQQAMKELSGRKEFQDRRRTKLVGKPSGALGKNWKLDKRKFSPNISGSKNPNWKGGKTPFVRKLRCLPEYNTWRLSIFLRDNFICVQCGSNERKKMQADHIIPLSVLLDSNNITDIEAAIDCRELWDTTNGRTLCVDCHKATDTWGSSLNRKKRA